ncbi:MAG: hypothetical protein AAGL29_04935 [Bacteroidota bacterium]
MKEENQAQKKAETLMDSLAQMEQVPPPPFFADKVMRQLTQTPLETSRKIPVWTVPKAYAAAFVLLVLVNAGILYSYWSNQEEASLETFAESYGFSETWDDNGLNL